MRIPAYLRFLTLAVTTTGLSVQAQDSDVFDPFSDEALADLEENAFAERDDSQKYLEPGKVRMLNNLAILIDLDPAAGNDCARDLGLRGPNRKTAQ